MDSLTQICLGAAVGELCLGKKVGNHAILWGAVLGTVPDLDVLFKPFFDFVGGLVMHRGFSHSLLFFVIFSPLFGYLIQKFHIREHSIWRWTKLPYFLNREPNLNNTTALDWTKFAFWVMLTHAILDAFTSWGTMLFWPHPIRVAWNNIFVADLLYTLPLLVCLIWLMFLQRETTKRRKLNTIGLVLSSAYMLITIVNKQVANSAFEESLEKNNIQYSDYSSRPTPLNSILWDAVAETEDEFHLGYYSLLSKDGIINWKSYPKNHDLMSAADGQKNWEKLKHFSNQEYIVEKTESDTLLVHDLRFGRMQFPGGESRWVFTFLTAPDENGIYQFSQEAMPGDGFNWEEFTTVLKDVLPVLWEGIKGNRPAGL